MPMAEWSKNNRAHALTWFNLRVLDQLATGFQNTASLKVSDLTFWGALSTKELRNVQANTIAINLDNMFRMINNATFEAGADRPTAIQLMHEALSNGETTIPELAAIADANYRFLDELTVD
jgi:hypothetical protein